jgi:hypothetical protein
MATPAPSPEASTDLVTQEAKFVTFALSGKSASLAESDWLCESSEPEPEFESEFELEPARPFAALLVLVFAELSFIVSFPGFFADGAKIAARTIAPTNSAAMITANIRLRFVRFMSLS